jgi:hypothetical protein
MNSYTSLNVWLRSPTWKTKLAKHGGAIIIPEVGRLKQEDCKFESSMSYKERLCLKKSFIYLFGWLYCGVVPGRNRILCILNTHSLYPWTTVLASLFFRTGFNLRVSCLLGRCTVTWGLCQPNFQFLKL